MEELNLDIDFEDVPQWGLLNDRSSSAEPTNSRSTSSGPEDKIRRRPVPRKGHTKSRHGTRLDSLTLIPKLAIPSWNSMRMGFVRSWLGISRTKDSLFLSPLY